MTRAAAKERARRATRGRNALRALLRLDAPGVRACVEETARALESGRGDAASAFQAWRALQSALSCAPTGESTSPVCELAPNLDADACLFLDQTRAAQIVQAIIRRRFGLSRALCDRLFADSLFAWANDAYERLPLDDARLDALDLDADPFADVGALVATYDQRRRLGEFYTPRPLAEFLVARAERLLIQSNAPAASPSLLDPNCGSGVFLTAAARRKIAVGLAAETVANLVEGYDLSPLAVVVARANLLFALYPVPDARTPENVAALLDARAQSVPDAPALPVRLFDALRDAPPGGRGGRGDARKFDLLLGNPPWLGWDKLSPECREATRRYWLEYGLFNLSSKDGRYGGGKKEFAGLMVYATIDRRLARNGVFAFVLPERLMRSGKSGEGFRQFGRQGGEASTRPGVAGEADRRVPAPFLPLELDDFAEFNLFPQVSSRAIALLGRKSDEPPTPILVRKWRRDGTCDGADDAVGAAPELAAFSLALREKAGARGAACAPLRAESDLRRIRIDELAAKLLADPARTSGYRGQLGANAAGACGVFWVKAGESPRPGVRRIVNLYDVGRVKTPRVEAEIEEAALFPLLRWRDVDEFRAVPRETFMIVPQNPTTRRGRDLETMRTRFPLTLRYLERFEEILRARAAFKRYQARAPFWSLYNVDESTFAPFKVVWRRMDRRLRAAAVVASPELGAVIVPQESLSLSPVADADEADYLAALLNSTAALELAVAAAAPGAKGFGSPGTLDEIKPPRFQRDDPTARELAALGRELRLEKNAPKEDA